MILIMLPDLVIAMKDGMEAANDATQLKSLNKYTKYGDVKSDPISRTISLKLIESFTKLPRIGQKTATRLAFYIL